MPQKVFFEAIFLRLLTYNPVVVNHDTRGAFLVAGKHSSALFEEDSAVWEKVIGQEVGTNLPGPIHLLEGPCQRLLVGPKRVSIRRL